MNVNGINTAGTIPSQRDGQRKSNSKNNDFSVPSAASGLPANVINLTIGGLSSRGLADGSNVTIYKSDAYTQSQPDLRMVTTYPDGRTKEHLMDPREVDPSNASESEMLALHAYLLEQGKVGIDISHIGILQGTNISDGKTDYLKAVKELAMMQYNAHNLSGYAQYNEVLGAYEAFLDSK